MAEFQERKQMWHFTHDCTDDITAALSETAVQHIQPTLTG